MCPSTSSSDSLFTGSIAKLYEEHLVPLLFEPYADDLARRVSARPVARVLEVAAGTGVVTRRLAAVLPAHVEIVATDLNPGMLEQAAAIGTARPVTWRPADATSLPFDDASFDAVICQFGVMFFPDRAKAHSEAHRVLRPGGLYAFNVWDRLANNEIAEATEDALAAHFPSDPPRFLGRTPYGYYDPSVIRRDLAAGGFEAPPAIETRAARSRASSSRSPAIAYCQGTPLRGEIEARGDLAAATEFAAHEIARRFGSDSIDAGIQAFVISVERGPGG